VLAAVAWAGGEGPLDRVRALVEEKRRLAWENETLTRELTFASTPSPYIFVDLKKGTFEFRVRGKAHKTYKASSVEILDGSGKSLPEAILHALAPDPVEVTEKAGGPPELHPPASPGDANKAGQAPDANGDGPPGGVDPNGGPVHSDAGILGVDAPSEYDIELEDGLRIEIRTPKAVGRWARLWNGMGEIASAFGNAVTSVFGRSSSSRTTLPGMAVRATVDEETAKAFYHSILPGEHLYFLPAEPPPVQLVASLSPPPPAGATDRAAPTTKKK